MIDVTNVFGKTNGNSDVTNQSSTIYRRPRSSIGWRTKVDFGRAGSLSDEDKKSESGISVSSSATSSRSSSVTRVVHAIPNPITEVVPENVVKHPLENTWTMWYFKPDKSKSWQESQQQVYNVSFIEDFWALYNHLEKASNLTIGCDYSFFKEGIRPEWEDNANKDGGRWLVNLDTRGRQKNKAIDKYWLEILLCMIGESFGNNSDQICGAVCNIRQRGDKLAVWTADAQSDFKVMDVGHLIKDRLQLGPMKLEYGSHSDTAAKMKRGTAKVHRL